MAKLKSWNCKGCTNICYRLFEGTVHEYCRAVVEYGGNRKEWQGDYIACLDYTRDPKATDRQVKIHEDSGSYE